MSLKRNHVTPRSHRLGFEPDRDSPWKRLYLTNIRARTLGQKEPKPRTPIDSLDGLGMVRVQGFGLLPAAVAWQTQTPMRKLIEQQAETGLSYGELLIVDSLAARSKHSFSEVVGMRARTRTWAELAEKLRVSPDLIVIRANAASSRIRAAEARSRKRGERDPGTPSTNPSLHTYSAFH
ncbi:MAG: hypothetical protein H0T83_00430 [Chthoniobacterales bacterium]|nr:hypothetical protein [Chthoniobacterales bacterium]